MQLVYNKLSKGTNISGKQNKYWFTDPAFV